MQLQPLLWAITLAPSVPLPLGEGLYSLLWARKQRLSKRVGRETPVSALTYQPFHICSSFYAPHPATNFPTKEAGWRGALLQGSGPRLPRGSGEIETMPACAHGEMARHQGDTQRYWPGEAVREGSQGSGTLSLEFLAAAAAWLRKPSPISVAWMRRDYFLLRRGLEGSSGLFGIREGAAAPPGGSV